MRLGVTATEYGLRSQLSFRELNCGNVCLQYTWKSNFLLLPRKIFDGVSVRGEWSGRTISSFPKFGGCGYKSFWTPNGFSMSQCYTDRFYDRIVRLEFQTLLLHRSNLCPLIVGCIDIILPNLRSLSKAISYHSLVYRCFRWFFVSNTRRLILRDILRGIFKHTVI